MSPDGDEARGLRPAGGSTGRGASLLDRKRRVAPERQLLDAAATRLADGIERTSLELLQAIARSDFAAQVGWKADEVDKALRRSHRFARGPRGWHLRVRHTASSRDARSSSAGAGRRRSRRPVEDSPRPAELPSRGSARTVPLARFVPGHALTWGHLLRALEDAMGDDDLDYVLVTVHEPLTGRPLYRYMIDLLLLAEPRWTVSTSVETSAPARVEMLCEAGWFLWPSLASVDWFRRDRLARPSQIETPGNDLLAVYKTPSKRYAARAVVSAARREVSASAAVTADAVRVRQSVVKDRRHWRRSISRYLPRGAAGSVLGHCAVCGRPLRTQESAQIGIGPECLGRLRSDRGLPPEVRRRPAMLAAIARSTVPVAYWARAVPTKRWSQRVGRMLGMHR